MKICKVCGKPYRLSRLAYVPDAEGHLQRMRVCRRCAEGGLSIVLKRPELKAVTHEVRNPQLDAIKRRIETFRSAWASPAGGAGMAAGRVEAYDQCLALVAAAQEGRPL